MNLTVQQAAERLGVCHKTVLRRIQTGKIIAQHDGPRIIRISEEDLQSYIDRCKKQAPTVRKKCKI